MHLNRSPRIGSGSLIELLGSFGFPASFFVNDSGDGVEVDCIIKI